MLPTRTKVRTEQKHSVNGEKATLRIMTLSTIMLNAYAECHYDEYILC